MNQPIELKGQHGRVAIVAGQRTPFCRIATAYREMTSVQLGAEAVKSVLACSELDTAELDHVVFGHTIIQPAAPFIGREVILAAGLDPNLDGYTVTRACATSFQSAADAAMSIAAGYADVVLAGGVDMSSDVPLTYTRNFSQTMRDIMYAAKTPVAKARRALALRPTDLMPAPPAIAEYSTGQTMGDSAEAMAKKWGISREEQDDIAHASHSRAAQAWADGHMAKQVSPVTTPSGAQVERDNLVRTHSERSQYARLKPVYDPNNGTLTAGNSSPLTDGAAALILMSESRAKALGYEPLAYIKSFGFSAKTPQEDLLMGPVRAAATALERAGASLTDIDVFDMHEAFAAQVACNIRGMASAKYAQEIGLPAALGEVDREKLNLQGGSLAYGHPFGATGARVLMQAAHLLRDKDASLAMTTACAAGGIGVAMILERS